MIFTNLGFIGQTSGFSSDPDFTSVMGYEGIYIYTPYIPVIVLAFVCGLCNPYHLLRLNQNNPLIKLVGLGGIGGKKVGYYNHFLLVGNHTTHLKTSLPGDSK